MPARCLCDRQACTSRVNMSDRKPNDHCHLRPNPGSFRRTNACCWRCHTHDHARSRCSSSHTCNLRRCQRCRFPNNICVFRSGRHCILGCTCKFRPGCCKFLHHCMVGQGASIAYSRRVPSPGAVALAHSYCIPISRWRPGLVTGVRCDR
jgi:hypothetical protein